MSEQKAEPEAADEEKVEKDPAQSPEGQGQSGDAAETSPEQKVKYSVSPGLSSFLGSNRIGLAITSYQSGKFYLLGQNKDGGLLIDERFFRKAMGISVPDQKTILLATLF